MTDTDESSGKPGETNEPEPGDAQSVPVPHDQAVEGSSETFKAVEGVRVIHPPAGHADAEDDNGN